MDVYVCVIEDISEVVDVDSFGASLAVVASLLFVTLSLLLSSGLQVDVDIDIEVEVSLLPSSGLVRKSPSRPSIFVSGFLTASHSVLNVLRKPAYVLA